MKHFTIDSDNNITLHATKKAAKETGAAVFSTEEQLADTIGPDNKRLVEIYNSLPGVTPVKKFANRKTATERIWKAIQGLGQAVDAPAPVQPEALVSCVEAVEALPTSEAQAEPPQPATPFDGPEPQQDPVAGEHRSAIETAAANIAEPAAAATEELATGSAQTPHVAPPAPKTAKKTTRAKKAPKAAPETTEPTVETAAKGKDATGPREGSKMAQVIAMLKRENGATLSEIMEKMGWLKHTVRGFMAGAMKKAGFHVESFKPEGGERTYRINAGGR